MKPRIHFSIRETAEDHPEGNVSISDTDGTTSATEDSFWAHRSIDFGPSDSEGFIPGQSPRPHTFASGSCSCALLPRSCGSELSG